jgi:hypothetical protein
MAKYFIRNVVKRAWTPVFAGVINLFETIKRNFGAKLSLGHNPYQGAIVRI